MELGRDHPLPSTGFSKGLSDTLEAHDGKVSTDSRTIANLLFADGIDAVGEEQQKL